MELISGIFSSLTSVNALDIVLLSEFSCRCDFPALCGLSGTRAGVIGCVEWKTPDAVTTMTYEFFLSTHRSRFCFPVHLHKTRGPNHWRGRFPSRLWQPRGCSRSACRSGDA